MRPGPLLGQLATAAGPPPEYARPADWNRVRPIIKRLYVDEDKTLREVMALMANDYGHRGTVKMYKSRIEKWGFDKNNKEDEARAIVRKKLERDAVGKKSVFRVRGKDVAIADVMRYFRRKGIMHPEPILGSPRPPTPPAIECVTPAPSPSPHDAWDLADEEIQRDLDWFDPPDMNLDLMPGTMAQSLMQAPKPNQVCLSLDQIHQILFSDPGIPRSPLPPQSLVECEKLFAAIKTYYAGAFDSGMFITNNDGLLFNGGSNHYDNTIFEFLDSCSVLADTSIMNNKSFTKGRRCLSRALNLVGKVLREQNPRAFDYFCYALQVLHQYPEIITMLRNQFSRMAAIIFPEGHPWRQIFIQFSMLDGCQLQQAINQSRRCTYDVFVESIGQFHRYSLILYSVSICCEYSPSDAIIALASLLEQAEQKLAGTALTTIDLKHEYGKSLHLAEKYEEALVIHKEILATSREHQSQDEIIIESLEYVAQCHYNMGHVQEAELSVREAIELNEKYFGEDDTNNLVLKLRLEPWLREWGRETEAEELRVEIDDLLGYDEIDMQEMIT